MDFKIKELKLAYDSEGILYSIEGATKQKEWYLDKESKIPLTLANGDVNTKHWRRALSVSDKDIRNYFGNSESLSHYNAKMSYLLNPEFILADNLFKGASAVVEYRCKEINKIIDAVLIDSEGKPLIGIEILQTNKKTEQDIEQFNKLNYPIYEYNINTEEKYPISAGDTDTEESEPRRERIEAINRRLVEVTQRLTKSREPVSELRRRTEMEGKKYYKIRREIEDAEELDSNGADTEIGRLQIAFNKEVRTIEDKIRDITEELKGYQDYHRSLKQIENLPFTF